jgi:hypothetical protein
MLREEELLPAVEIRQLHDPEHAATILARAPLSRVEKEFQPGERSSSPG